MICLRSVFRLPLGLQHNKSWYTLKGTCEIHDKSNKWFRSFLENSKQHITINKARSSDKPVSIRVPQGSILGPIFFILFINDFHEAVEFSTVHHSADDTNLLLTENSLKELSRISECRKNKDCYFCYQEIERLQKNLIFVG